MALSIATALACGSVSTAAIAAGSEQMTFASPEQAVAAFVAATRSGKTPELLRILGPDGKRLVHSGDPIADKQAWDNFISAYGKGNKIIMQAADKAVLVIGEREWPFPIPVVKQAGAWRFDTRDGEQEILDRRIGRNELNAIQVCRAYVDAQREYASQDRNADGLIEYAPKFMSRPHRHDGLYWPVRPGEPQSPLGPLMASAQAQGYGTKTTHSHQHKPYHGYFYRILTRQGKNAHGGAYNYLVKGHMIGGFALVAYPAQYGVSGIMTFLINQDGVVYQKDLGRNTARIARRMTEFNPDTDWNTP
ncbi:MAG: DUF2950 domain-containing protein [Sulfuricaulis sp.]